MTEQQTNSNSTAEEATRTYEVRTFGRQMNVHDSERLSGLLENAGLNRKPEEREDEVADVVVFNTCAVRENADNKLYGNLGILKNIKAERPTMQIAVGTLCPEGSRLDPQKGTLGRCRFWHPQYWFSTHVAGSFRAQQKGGAGDP